jgi:hypothetical protein
MDTALLTVLLAQAEAQHEAATHPQDVAYWQGKKDALRALLAECANAPELLTHSATSVFAFEQAQRAFTPTSPALADLPDTSAPLVPCLECGQTYAPLVPCLECGQTYFHRPGCLHGLGLSPAQFAQLHQAGVVAQWARAQGLTIEW